MTLDDDDDLEDDELLEPLDIDDRSPGERWVQGAGAGFGRIRQLADESPFDLVALLWMVCVLVTFGIEVFTRFQISGGITQFPGGGSSHGRDWWVTIAEVGQTGGLGLATSSVIGLAAAVIFGGRAARVTCWLAGIGGAWVAGCGVMVGAVALHGSEVLFELGITNRPAGVGLGLVTLVAGVLVMYAAARGASFMGRTEYENDDYEYDSDPEPESDPGLAELS